MCTIAKVWAREILDSRGNPTVEVEVGLENGVVSRAAVPSGASTGTREAVELRDGNMSRYQGKGVLQAVSNVIDIIGQSLIGMNALRQPEIDATLLVLDGTKNKSKLGANAMLGVSMAVARAAAISTGLPLYQYLGGVNAKVLPAPMMNIINGGAHAQNTLDIQEFMILPLGAETFSEALRMGVEVFHHLKSILNKDGLSTGIGDEGGFAPNIKTHEQALEYIMRAIDSAGYEAGKQIVLGIDAAASEFYKNDKYNFKGEGRSLCSDDLIDYYGELSEKFPLVSIEDGLAESDWAGWEKLTTKLGDKLQIVGDDIFVTNPAILAEGIEKNVGNSILIKLNQIGTVTETLDTIEMAKEASYSTIISHRSGETEDSFISDLAVATNAGQIKTGSLCRSDRLAKYNQLIRIEEELDSYGIYFGQYMLENWL